MESPWGEGTAEVTKCSEGNAFTPSHKQNMASHLSPLTFEWGVTVGRSSSSWAFIKSHHLSPPSLSPPCPASVISAWTAARSLPTSPCPAQQTEGLIQTSAGFTALPRTLQWFPSTSSQSASPLCALEAWLGLSSPALPCLPLFRPCSHLSSH